ncbi:MAG: DUF4256 domain-containing protein [Eubacteriales bacterium]|nr:DUF4256 domain-containing protein [Eubacteriales bacterium]
MASGKNTLSDKERAALLDTLKARFENNMPRHRGVTWDEVLRRLERNPDKLRSLNRMEETGGEPDVVEMDKKTGEPAFMDCAAQSPAGRRSLCFDEAALAARKKNKPEGSAEGMAREMGITLLTEEDYGHLQSLGEFDTTTSSWIQTPTDMREKGGALFGDRRYGRVFFYHNGAESYYAARGFRGKILV